MVSLIFNSPDGSIIIWKQAEDEQAQMVIDEDSKENWKLIAFLR
jgi:hypothetical protein